VAVYIFVGKFICVGWISVLVLPDADEGVGGDRADEGVEAGGDGARAKTSVRGASAAETARDNTDVDAAAAPEGWLLKNRFILGWVIFVEFKWCTKPTQLPQGSRPTWGMDIIYVDTPSGEAVEKSSSYNLSNFFF
jgi:hypothetical protein